MYHHDRHRLLTLPYTEHPHTAERVGTDRKQIMCEVPCTIQTHNELSPHRHCYSTSTTAAANSQKASIVLSNSSSSSTTLTNSCEASHTAVPGPSIWDETTHLCNSGSSVTGSTHIPHWLLEIPSAIRVHVYEVCIFQRHAQGTAVVPLPDSAKNKGPRITYPSF